MDSTQKEGRYKRIFDQLEDLLKDKPNSIARMATIASVLHHKMDYFFWTGFYLLDDGELIVGPYQGSLACIRLKNDTGVCWAGINQAKTIIVPDVHQFPGHIACDSRSNSEIVIPLNDDNGRIIGVLDVDSKAFNSFDIVDAKWLEKIVKLLIPNSKSQNLDSRF
jgi:L-methionine (R)-S-oxide reductase